MESGTSGGDSERLNRVIADYLLAAEQGKSPDRDDLMLRHPELARELVSFFEDHDHMLEHKGGAVSKRPGSWQVIDTVVASGTEGLSTSSTGPSHRVDLGTADGVCPRSLRSFGDYEILEEIARGGMGVVYKARQVSLDRTVAVKMILGGQLATDEDVARFQAEAKAAAQLDHPGIVPVHEVGEHEGQHFFSMGYVEGMSLSGLIAQGPMHDLEAAQLVKSIAEAVQYAHDQGVIHRDLKPANVLLKSSPKHDNQNQNVRNSRTTNSSSSAGADTPDFRPLITDFGLAKTVGCDSHLTATGQVLGTPSYMPPEQAAGKLAQVGVAADVYSLGAILYALLTGRPPFQAANRLDILMQVVGREPVPPHLMNPRIHHDLETIVLRCLEKDPRRRYATAQQLVDELGRFLNGEPVLARPIGRSARVWRWCRRRPMMTAMIALATLSLVTGTITSTYFAVQAQGQAIAATKARNDATEKLRNSYLAQARAQRWSGKSGRRFESLDVLTMAAQIRPSLELRNEAIACMALADLRVVAEWNVQPPSAIVEFDPELDRYACSEPDGSISVRSVGDDAELLRLPGEGTSLEWILRFSPDGQMLVAKYGKEGVCRVKVWNLQRCEVAFEVPFPVSLQSIDFHPDGRRLALADRNGVVRVYDIATWSECRQLTSSLTAPYAIEFDPYGERLAISANPATIVEVIDLKSEQVEMSFSHPAGVRGIAWSPDGATLATTVANGQIHLWDLRSGQSVRVLDEHTNVATRVLFSPPGDLFISSAWGANTLLWNFFHGESLLTVGGEPLQFHGNGQLLAYKWAPYRAGIWEVATGHEFRTFGPGAGKTPLSWVRGTVSPGGRWLATSDLTAIQLWDLATCRQAALLPMKAQTVVINPQGRCFFSAGSAGLHRWPFSWERNDEEDILRIDSPRRIGPSHAMQDAAISGDGRMLAAVGQGRVYGLSLGSEGEFDETVLIARHANVQHVAIDGSGRWIASSTWKGTGVKVWDVRDGHLAKDLPISGSALVTFSSDGRWLATSSGQRYELWHVGTWKPVWKVPREVVDGGPASLEFAPDNRLLAISEFGNVVRLIATDTGQELARLTAGRQGILCFDPTGAQLFVVADGLICGWNLPRIREQLATMNLDWDLAPYPQPSHADQTRPLRVVVPREFQSSERD